MYINTKTVEYTKLAIEYDNNLKSFDINKYKSEDFKNIAVPSALTLIEKSSL
jgi:hypothetical protein